MKNTLVRYSGGGYDGCIWEWNYAYFDGQGKFYNIYASGVAGLPEEPQVREAVAQAGKDAPELFDLTKAADRTRLDEIHAESIIMIARWLAEIEFELLVRCDACKTDVDVSDIELIDFQKDGGIVYTHHGKVCYECYSDHLCDGCYNYIPGELKTVGDEEQFCAFCYDLAMEEASQKCLLCGSNEYTDDLTLEQGICTECWESPAGAGGVGSLHKVTRTYAGKEHTLIIADA